MILNVPAKETLDVYLYHIRGPPSISKIRNKNPWKSETAGPWLSGLRHPTYNRGDVFTARPRVRIPPDPPICYHPGMKVDKKKFDDTLAKLLTTKPLPRTEIKVTPRKRVKNIKPAH
jgi:hypothetical protein